MLDYSIWQRCRQYFSRIPVAQKLYDVIRLTFRPTYFEDGLLTIHNSDFLTDEKFRKAYDRALQQQDGLRIRWRAHVTQWAGQHASNLEGDYVECGVNRAFLSTSLMTYIDFDSMQDRRFFLFDTYSGLVKEQITDADKAAYRNKYEDCYEFVCESFKDKKNVVIVRGIVPDSLSTVDIDKVAYLSIDMNCAEPEEMALKHFWPKLVKGAVVILDDYGFPAHEAQKLAADEFASSVNVEVLTLPTGQGLIVKP
jgi:O-methyltransferase